MSNKGKTFTTADLPRLTQQRLKNKQVGEAEQATIDAWLKAQNERNRVVAMDGKTPIIAEELAERLMRSHAEGDGDVLAMVRGLNAMPLEQRLVVLESFGKDGELVNHFKKAKA
jgi:hypothetical protein